MFEPIQNDAILFGILASILGIIFYLSNSENRYLKGFFKYVPVLLLCYLIPALLNWPLGLIGEDSNLYFVASRYLLPASLILLCLSIDVKALIRLGPKALIMFFAATFGIIIGGPIALLITSQFFPDIIDVKPDELWRGLSTVAGSWIGGGANQAAMKEIYMTVDEPAQQSIYDNLFGTMIVIDVIVANIWLGFLLYGAKISDRIDRAFKADNSAIADLKERVGAYSKSVTRIPQTKDLFYLLAIAFAGVGFSHFFSDSIVPLLEPFEETLKDLRLTALVSNFFWLVVIATTIGVLLSFTPARKLEGVGASRWGSLFIYILVATIGIQMDIGEVFDNLGLFVIGLIWMFVHVIILLLVAYLIKAPFFFVAVGSQANIGGAASAPIVASAFDIALAPVGVIMAVFGYAMGTFGAILCAQIMEAVVAG